MIELAEQVPTDPAELCCTLGWKAMEKELAVRIMAEVDKLFRVLSRRLQCRRCGEVQNRFAGRWQEKNIINLTWQKRRGKLYVASWKITWMFFLAAWVGSRFSQKMCEFLERTWKVWNNLPSQVSQLIQNKSCLTVHLYLCFNATNIRILCQLFEISWCQKGGNMAEPCVISAFWV